MLKENALSGIGYNSLDEIIDRMNESETEEILNENLKKILREYDENCIKAKFRKWISSFGII